MSNLVVTWLIECEQRLVKGLDDHNVEEIEAAASEIKAAVIALGSDGAWADDPDTCVLLVRASAIARAAQERLRALSDHNALRLNALNSIRGAYPNGVRYGFDGRILSQRD
jgi:hypothetical protein